MQRAASEASESQELPSEEEAAGSLESQRGPQATLRTGDPHCSAAKVMGMLAASPRSLGGRS